MRPRSVITRFLLTAVSLLLLGCWAGSDERRLRRLVAEEADPLETVTARFLSDSALHAVTIAGWLDPTYCESVNGWRRCGRKEPWKNWNVDRRDYDYLPDVEAVLAREKIPVRTYQFYTKFLQDNDLHTLNRALECADCVDIEIGLYGLRYSRDTTYHLSPDREYLRVERLRPNWHFYVRDWN